MPSTKIEMLEFILDVAERAGVRTAIGGGIAVAAHGYRRGAETALDFVEKLHAAWSNSD